MHDACRAMIYYLRTYYYSTASSQGLKAQMVVVRPVSAFNSRAGQIRPTHRRPPNVGPFREEHRYALLANVSSVPAGSTVRPHHII